MRAVVQRVSRASVHVEGQEVGQVGLGLLVLLGVGPEDGEAEVAWLVSKLPVLRIFEDEQGKMNLDLMQVSGGILLVSQFTLYADCSRGRRPSFIGAARPELAEPLVQDVVAALREAGVPVQTGRFGAEMRVSLVNEGPVTLVLDSPVRA